MTKQRRSKRWVCRLQTNCSHTSKPPGGQTTLSRPHPHFTVEFWESCFSSLTGTPPAHSVTVRYNRCHISHIALDSTQIICKWHQTHTYMTCNTFDTIHTVQTHSLHYFIIFEINNKQRLKRLSRGHQNLPLSQNQPPKVRPRITEHCVHRMRPCPYAFSRARASSHSRARAFSHSHAFSCMWYERLARLDTTHHEQRIYVPKPQILLSQTLIRKSWFPAKPKP